MEREELQQAEELLTQMKYSQGLPIVESIEKKKTLTQDDLLTCQILKSQIMTGKGVYEEGRRLAEAALIESQRQMKTLHEVDARIALAAALEALDKFEESLKQIHHCEQTLFVLKIDPVSLTRRKAALLFQKGRSLWKNFDPERAIVPLQQSLTLYEEVDNKHAITDCLRNIGNCYYLMGDLDRDFEYQQRSLTLSKEINNKLMMAYCLFNIGMYYRDEKSDAAKGLEYLQQCLAIGKEMDDKSLIAYYLNNIGDIYLVLGDLEHANASFQKLLAIMEEIGNKERLVNYLQDIGWSYLLRGAGMDQALEYLLKSLTMFEELEDKKGIALVCHGIGLGYRFKGELELALEYSHKSLSKHEEIDEPLFRVLPLENLATIYHAKGELEVAYEYSTKALSLSEESGNEFATALSLYSLVSLSLETNQIEEAKNYSQQLQTLHTHGYKGEKIRRGLIRPITTIGQYAKLTEALILKTSPRLKDKGKAQEILEQIAEETTMNFEITSTAMLNLCDLHIFELKASGEKTVLQETKNLVQQLTARARQQHSFSSVVDTLILQAKLAMVEGDLTVATQLLDQAQILAVEKGLTRLEKKATTESQLLEAQYDNWQHLIESNAPYTTRLKQARVEDYLTEALKMARAGINTTRTTNE
ncbi:MAG: tetratricopeptide repeat protein [Candidatus Hodarchaeales archaeon]